MPAIYDFQSEDGDVVERWFPSISKSPMSIRIDGKKYKRCVSDKANTQAKWKKYEVISQPKGFLPGAPVSKRTGRTIIESPAEERRAAEHILGHNGDNWGMSSDQKG